MGSGRDSNPESLSSSPKPTEYIFPDRSGDVTPPSNQQTPPLIESIEASSSDSESTLSNISHDSNLSNTSQPEAENPEPLTAPFTYVAPQNVSARNFQRTIPLKLKTEEVKKIGEFPGGGKQEKGPHAGEYIFNDNKFFAKCNNNPSKAFLEFMGGGIMAGYTRLCNPSVINNIAPITLFFSPEHEDVNFPDDTGKNVYVGSGAIPHFTELYIDVPYSQNKEIPDERPSVLKRKSVQSEMSTAIQNHRVDIDQVTWFQILSFIIKNRDVHTGNKGTINPSHLPLLIKACQHGIRNAKEFKKTVEHLKIAIAYAKQKELECSVNLTKLATQSSSANIQAKEIECREELELYKDGRERLEYLQNKYSLFEGRYDKYIDYSNLPVTLNDIPLIKADRNKKSCPIGILDFDACLKSLTDTWDLNETSVKNFLLFISSQPIGHSETYNEALQTKDFADWLEKPAQVTREQTDDMIVGLLLQAVQMFGPETLFKSAKEMGMTGDLQIEDMNLEQLKNSYAKLITAQKAEGAKPFHNFARINHPFVKAIRQYVATREYNRAQHCAQFVLPIRITAKIKEAKNLRIKNSDLVLSLKGVLERYYDELVKQLPHHGNFPLFNLEGDPAEYTEIIRAQKAIIVAEQIPNIRAQMQKFFDDCSHYTLPEKRLIINKPALITKIKEFLKNSDCASAVAREYFNKHQDTSFFFALDYKNYEAHEVNAFIKILHKVRKEVAPPITLTDRMHVAFRNVYNLEDTRLRNTAGLPYLFKTLVDFPDDVTPSSITSWVLSTGFVLPTLFKNSVKYIIEFLPAVLENLFAHGADQCQAYIKSENKKKSSDRRNVDLAYIGYGICSAAKHIVRSVRLITMRVTSPITSIQQAYGAGKEFADKIFGQDSITGKVIGGGLAILSACLSFGSYIALGIIAAPVVASVAPAIVGTKVTSAIAGFSSWLSSTSPVMGWIGSHITAGLAAVGIKTIAGSSIVPSTVALGGLVTAAVSEVSLLARSGVEFFSKIFSKKTTNHASAPAPVRETFAPIVPSARAVGPSRSSTSSIFAHIPPSSSKQGAAAPTLEAATRPTTPLWSTPSSAKGKEHAVVEAVKNSMS